MNLFSKKKCKDLPLSTFFIVVLFAATLIFSGCIGDNDNPSAVSSSVGGAAVKGPFKTGSTVEVYEINADGTLKAAPSWTGSTSDDQGNFSMDLGSYSGAVEVQVTGSYLNELTGVYENTSVPLKAVFYVGAEEDFTGNVNTATTLASEKAKKLMAEGKEAKEAVDQASSEAASLFSFITEAEFTALGAEEPKDYLKKLDITDITKAANAKFLLFNAAIMKLSKTIQVAGFNAFDPLKLIELMAKNLSPSGSQDWQVTESQMKELLDKDVLIPADTALLDGLTGKLNAYIAGIVAGIDKNGDAAAMITSLESISGFTGIETDLNQSFSMPEIKKTTSQGLLKYEGSDIKVNLENKPLTSEGINVSEKDGIVTAEVISPDYTYGTSTGATGDDMYLFVQKVDKNKVEIVAEELVCEECNEQLSESGLTKTVFPVAGSTEKPTPKTISSSDASTSVVITNMKLKKDITMAVTPYKAPLYVPQLNQIGEDIGDTSVIVISGGDVNIVDANGVPVTAAEACFCATVRFISAKIIGEMTGQEIYDKVTAGQGSLHLLVFKEKKWQMVDQPQVTITDQGGGTYALKQNMGKSLRMYPFVFVFKPKAELIFTGSISGTVTDKGGNPLKGVLVGLKGSDTFDVTSSAEVDKGVFEIPYKSFISEEPVTHILSFKKPDYLDATQSAQVTSTLPYATGIDAQLEKIQNVFDLSGQVKKKVDGVAEGIGGALVTLNTPVVLDNIAINGTTITTGLDSTATYTWEIMDNGTIIYTDSGTGAEGKNIFALDSSAQAVMTVDGVYSLKATVVHTISGNTYTESQTGVISKEGSTYTAVMDPTSLYPSELTVKADGSGYYLFENLDQNMDGFLSLKGEATGYQPSALISLPAGNISENQLSENIVLESQAAGDAQAGETAVTGLYSEGFETEAIDQNWTFENTSNLVGWQVLSNPETVMVSEGIVDGVLFPDRKTNDVAGTITAITDSTATVSFTKEGETEPTTVSVTLTDTNGDQLFDSVTNNYNTYETARYDVWLQGYAEELAVDSQVMVSYPDPFNTEISLLPAFGGDTVLWYGYTGTGTFSDEESNTSTEPNSGEATSPVIDLTSFSYATGSFKTWYEVESVDVSSGDFDQMRIFVAVVDDQTEDADIPIYDGNTLYQFTKGTYYELITLNPSEEPPGMQQAFLNYSSGGVNAIPTWVNRELNLNPFAGHKIRLKFSFVSNDVQYNGFRGWAIDDASITNEKSDLDFIDDELPQPQPVQPVEDYLKSIRDDIGTIMETDSAEIKDTAMDSALSSLNAALFQYPENQEVNMIQGIFQAYNLVYGNTDLNALITKLGGVMPDEGEVLAKYAGQPFYPADIVTYKSYFNTDVLAKIDECLAFLDKVEINTTSAITVSGQEYEVDYSDVVLVKASLKWVKGIINWALAYDWNVDESNLALLTDSDEFNDPSDESIFDLEANTNLFDFASGYQAYLDKAKAALIETCDDFKSGIDLVINEIDEQNNDIFTFGNLKELKEAEYFKTTLSDIKSSLNYGEYDIHNYNFVYVLGSQPQVCDIYEEFVTCNLAKIFDGSISLLDIIPDEYDSFGEVIFTETWLAVSPFKLIFPDAELDQVDYDDVNIPSPETKLEGASFEYEE